jgi:hypothetical protein
MLHGGHPTHDANPGTDPDPKRAGKRPRDHEDPEGQTSLDPGVPLRIDIHAHPAMADGGRLIFGSFEDLTQRGVDWHFPASESIR